MQFELLTLFFIGFFSISASAYRFGLDNVTCKGLHGVHCGTYLLKVKGQDNTFIGQTTFVGADVLSSGSEHSWGRYLKGEYRFLPRFTTVQELNTTKNFRPLVGTTNQRTCNFQSIESAMVPYINTVTKELSFDAWAFTSLNSTEVTGLANQLLNATTYGVQVATCNPGFITGLLKSPTVNIFNIEDPLPSWCTPIEIEPVCPITVDYIFSPF